MMKKSTFGAMLAFLFAAAGALTAAALYLYRREKELDEYERLLFNDECEDDGDDEYDDGPVYEKIQDEPAATEPEPTGDADEAGL
ncbi:phosphatase [uncultured Subdoligranulum sp.]|uniref:phosphatase n=1 Tax=uncultured Subdoligranulum sp. TaxID=512298 RepID=UPI00320B7CB4